jgi:recombinational DNA repair protein (RecF pathway)
MQKEVLVIECVLSVFVRELGLISIMIKGVSAFTGISANGTPRRLVVIAIVNGLYSVFSAHIIDIVGPFAINRWFLMRWRVCMADGD